MGFFVFFCYLCVTNVLQRFSAMKQQSKTATASIYLDTLRPKQNGQCSLKVKITFNRQRKYYQTGLELIPEEFTKVMEGKRKTNEQAQTLARILAFQAKAQKAIDALRVFTFSAFEEIYLEQRNITDNVYLALDAQINQLKSEGRISTSDSFKNTKNSLQQFSKKLTFAEITPSFLKKYEAWMLKQGKSITTVGIYLRSLRVIFNQQNIDNSLYPFGEGKGKYSIPTGKNIKKALTIEEISRIYNYEAPANSMKAMAKDYWLFLYLSNGMNVKDFCLLKWKNIEGNTLTYHRAKTKRSKRESQSITVSLKPESLEIIRKWGVPSLSPEAFIFPHLQPGITPERERAIYQQLTKIINKYMKEIAKETGIEKEVTTYFARHSFATVLKRSGASVEMISELLGHSSVNVTQSYLGSFEREQIEEQTNVLTSFKKAQ